MDKLGNTPLPKYIKETRKNQIKKNYQTVFGEQRRRCSCPTAGLHFSKELMKRLEIKGVDFAELYTTYRLGTFRSIDVEDLSKHKMDAEYFKIDEKCAKTVNCALQRNKKIYALLGLLLCVL